MVDTPSNFDPLPELPEPASRADAKEDYSRKADATNAAQYKLAKRLNVFVTWLNALIAWIAAARAAMVVSQDVAVKSADAAARSLASFETIAAALRAQINLPSLVGQKGKFWRVAQDEKTLELADVTQTISKYFVSAAQQLVRGGSININHGLGQRPKIMSAFITCTTAENGYAVGDVLEVSLAVTPYTTQNGSSYPVGMGVLSDATTITLLFHSTGIAINTKNNLNGSMAYTVFASTANWTISVRAFV